MIKRDSIELIGITIRKADGTTELIQPNEKLREEIERFMKMDYAHYDGLTGAVSSFEFVALNSGIGPNVNAQLHSPFGFKADEDV